MTTRRFAALTRALTAEGFHVLSWASADAFLADYDPDKPGCVVADVAMPGTDGLQLQSLLSVNDHALPIVFITGNATVRMSVQAMRAGAVTFLPKPVRLSELAAAVREALERDRATRQKHAARAAIQARLAALTARERQVFDLVVAGKMNKTRRTTRRRRKNRESASRPRHVQDACQVGGGTGDARQPGARGAADLIGRMSTTH
jgi:FixJ family two-component response regulator